MGLLFTHVRSAVLWHSARRTAAARTEEVGRSGAVGCPKPWVGVVVGMSVTRESKRAQANRDIHLIAHPHPRLICCDFCVGQL